MYVGGDGAHTLQRVIEYGDGWMPIPMRGGGPLSQRIQELQRLATEAGRGPIPVTCFGVQPRPEIIEHYAEIGVERCIFFIPPVPEEQALPMLDRYTELTKAFATAGA